MLLFRKLITIMFFVPFQVFDGTTSSSSLGVFTGVTNPSDITSTSNKMTIVFLSDEGNFQIPSVNAPGRWKATYTVV